MAAREQANSSINTFISNWFSRGDTYPNRKQVVRAAALADLDAIVRVELEAFSDVYGERPSKGVVRSVRSKYRERLKLLGEWVRVIENQQFGVYGVFVCCPTSYDRREFLVEQRDLTSNEAIHEIYDPKGKNVYVVNLAVLPKAQGRGAHRLLFADAIKKAIKVGMERAFFESRLPGLRHWLETLPDEEWDGESIRSLADKYWRLTDDANKPIDRLLRKYTNFGCVPLRLVENAWGPDAPSMGYGVLCEFTVPYQRVFKWVRDIRRMGKRISDHKKGIFWLTTIVVALAYSTLSSGLSETIGGLRGVVVWFLPAYIGSWIIMLSGLGMMIYGVGKDVSFKNLLLKAGTEMRAVAAKLPNFADSGLIRFGFVVNVVGALGAAGVVAGAVLVSMPLGAGLAAAAPAIADAYATVALRVMLVKAINKRRSR